LIRAQVGVGQLSFTSDARAALACARTLWVTFDTPVNDADRADPDWVAAQMETIRPFVAPSTLVIISSQVPVGFTRRIEQRWRAFDRTLSFACVPENLRLGQALEVFRHPERVVVGVGENVDRERIIHLLAPFCDALVWMSLESAEMSKHAVNGFLAVSVAYTNELARVCEMVGADAVDVERALRSEPRIGPRAYVSAGPPIAGGTLIRDLSLLKALAAEYGLSSPVVDGVLESNRLHQQWTRHHLDDLLRGMTTPRVALLGLTYKPGTDTLRRSSSVELARWLSARGANVVAYDPAIRTLPPELSGIELAEDAPSALQGADAAVLATAWPEFRSLSTDDFLRTMRRPCVIDQAGFLPHLGNDARLLYVRVGRPARLDAR
jgi:UDPglucose 6-dehydrogenase